MRQVLKKRVFISLLLTLITDLATKILCVRFPQITNTDLSPFLRLCLTRNTGVAFGALKNIPFASYLLAPCAVIFGIWLMKGLELDSFQQIAFGMVLGGFLGNWVNRLATGSVLDMLYFPWLPFFICNTADIAITAGCVFLLISLLFGKNNTFVQKEESGLDSQNDHPAN